MFANCDLNGFQCPAPRTCSPEYFSHDWNACYPTISTNLQCPATVYVNVTDQHSSVQNVTIIYTTDNWKMVNTTLLASYNATTTTATAQIPALASGGHVAFYVVAFNGNGIKGVNDNSGSYFGYD